MRSRELSRTDPLYIPCKRNSKHSVLYKAWGEKNNKLKNVNNMLMIVNNTKAMVIAKKKPIRDAIGAPPPCLFTNLVTLELRLMKT